MNSKFPDANVHILIYERGQITQSYVKTKLYTMSQKPRKLTDFYAGFIEFNDLTRKSYERAVVLLSIDTIYISWKTKIDQTILE